MKEQTKEKETEREKRVRAGRDKELETPTMAIGGSRGPLRAVVAGSASFVNASNQERGVERY